jgi:hypothetical protein
LVINATALTNVELVFALVAFACIQAVQNAMGIVTLVLRVIVARSRRPVSHYQMEVIAWTLFSVNQVYLVLEENAVPYQMEE